MATKFSRNGPGVLQDSRRKPCASEQSKATTNKTAGSSLQSRCPRRKLFASEQSKATANKSAGPRHRPCASEQVHATANQAASSSGSHARQTIFGNRSVFHSKLFPGRSKMADISLAGNSYNAQNGQQGRKRIFKDTLREESDLVPRVLDMTSPEPERKRRSIASSLYPFRSFGKHPAPSLLASASASKPPAIQRKFSLLSNSNDETSKISLLRFSEGGDLSPRHARSSFACSEDLEAAGAAALRASSDSSSPEIQQNSFIRRMSSIWGMLRGTPQSSPRPLDRTPVVSTSISSDPADTQQRTPSPACPLGAVSVASSESELEIEVMELDDMRIERDWYYRRLLGIETMSKFARDWCDKNPGNGEFEGFLDCVMAQLYCD